MPRPIIKQKNMRQIFIKPVVFFKEENERENVAARAQKVEVNRPISEAQRPQLFEQLRFFLLSHCLRNAKQM